MKKLPLVFAVLTGCFIALCIFQAWMWPAKEISGWQPEWWQFAILADFGYWIAHPSMDLLLRTSYFTKGSAFWELSVIFVPIFLIIVALVTGVYFLTSLIINQLHGKN